MTADELVKDLDQLMALPEAYVQISRMINSPRYSATDISKIVAQDTDLSARLLRIVNSAFYGIPAPVETISRAITIVGTTELHNLVLITSASQLFQDIPGELMDMTEFWSQSVYTGIVASALAEKCNVLHRERLFIQGMLHDIGRLPIFLRLPEQARDILLITNGNNDSLSTAEQEILGFTHAEVGGALTHSWNLPESIRTVARYHHEPHQAPEFQLEASLIHIGSILAGDGMGDASFDEMARRVDPFAWEITGMDSETVQAAVEAIPAQVAEILKLILSETA